MTDGHKTYQQQFPPGARVKITASPNDGTDVLWRGHTGEIVQWDYSGFFLVLADKPKRNWPNPVWIGCNNIRAA